MHRRCSLVFSLLAVVGSGSVMAQETGTHSAAEVRQAMVNSIAAIEEAAGMEPTASLAISQMSDDVAETLFSPMANKEQFVASAGRVVERIEAAKEAFQTSKSVSSTSPFLPSYPGNSNLHYNVALLLGLVDSPDDRCGGTALDDYESVLTGAEAAMVIGDAACSVAGCDPIAVFCLSICGAVEVTNLAVQAAKVPLIACAAHGGNVDSAEIEAAYENAKGALIDLAAHDTNIDGDLAAHDANIDGDLATHDSNLAAHDARILARLDELEAMLVVIMGNQDEMIRLLKTPQGRRPGWNRGTP